MSRFTLPLAAFVLLVASCGGDDQAGRTVTAPAGGTVQVVAEEYSFDPSTIVLRGAGPVTLTLRNSGSLAHNVKVLRQGQAIGGTPSFPPGQSKSARLNLEHGNYELVCTVGDHAELGMTGTLKVE